jgi:hypothetical protein
MVQVTNEANKTYFSGPRWTEMVNRYVMDVGERCIFYLDHQADITYFDYKSPNNSDDSGSESEDHDPRDISASAVSVVVHNDDEASS